VSAARSRPRAMCLRVRCGKCMDVRTVFGNSSVSSTGTGGGGAGDKMIQMGSSSPFSGFSLPTRCLGPNPQGEYPCFFVVGADVDMGFVQITLCYCVLLASLPDFCTAKMLEFANEKMYTVHIC
jgi:hypothetical protein